ncbi:MAG: hypothetical protein ACLUEQ_05030 [Cloacibacillus evryensis]
MLSRLSSAWGEGFSHPPFSPQGTVTGGAEVKAVFSHEAVSDDAVGRTLKPAEYPLDFSAAAGRLRQVERRFDLRLHSQRRQAVGRDKSTRRLRA